MSKWKKFITYWSMVDLQCCVGFRGTAKSLSYIYVCPLFSRFFPHIGYSRMLSRPPCAVQQVLFDYVFISSRV